MIPKKVSLVDKLRKTKRQMRLQRLKKRGRKEKKGQMMMHHASIARKCLAPRDQRRNGLCVIPVRNGHMICVQEFQAVKMTSYATFVFNVLKKAEGSFYPSRGTILPTSAKNLLFCYFP